MRVVVDASVAVEYLLVTPLHAVVEAVFRGAELLAPELIDAEVLAALRREVLAGRLDETRATEALDDLHAWRLRRLAHAPLLHDAWRLRHNVTAYDALYLAAAHRHGATLITADGPLARVPTAGVPIHNVRA